MPRSEALECLSSSEFWVPLPDLPDPHSRNGPAIKRSSWAVDQSRLRLRRAPQLPSRSDGTGVDSVVGRDAHTTITSTFASSRRSRASAGTPVSVTSLEIKRGSRILCRQTLPNFEESAPETRFCYNALSLTLGQLAWALVIVPD
jgi:hypothetical protein